MSYPKDTKEYFCYDCGQLRLSVAKTPNCCGYCSSTNIVVGEPYELDKATLKYNFDHSHIKDN